MPLFNICVMHVYSKDPFIVQSPYTEEDYF